MSTFCGRCGAPTEAQGRFCGSCGAPLGDAPSGLELLFPSGSGSGVVPAPPPPPAAPEPWQAQPPSPPVETRGASAGWNDLAAAPWQSEPALAPYGCPPPQPADSVPWANAAPPAGLISAVPGAPVRSVPEFVPNPQPRGRAQEPANPPPPPQVNQAAAWHIQIDDGRVVALDRPVLIGRSPSGPPGERTIALPDETRSVSKTHVRLEVRGGSVLVTDVHSTNGVVIVTSGAAVACEPGEATLAPAWSTVRFGDRELRVLPETPGME